MLYYFRAQRENTVVMETYQFTEPLLSNACCMVACLPSNGSICHNNSFICEDSIYLYK
jgi:hypothetical protein